MLPDFDVQTWRLPTHSWDLNHSLLLSSGWAWEPLWAEDPDESFPVVTHLMAMDVGAYRKFGPVYLSADVPLRAVWNGEVGIANPRVSVSSWGTSGMAASVLFPTDTLSTPISNPGWTVSGSIFTRLQFSPAVKADVEGGLDYRTESAYGPGVHGHVELTAHQFSVGARSLYLIGEQGGAVAEAVSSVTVDRSRLRWRPEIGVGLTRTPGTPKLRAVLTISTLPGPPKVRAVEVEAAKPEPPPLQPAPPEPAPAPAVEALSSAASSTPPAEPTAAEPVLWAVIEVHPPCGVDPVAWTAPRAKAARTLIVQQGVEDAHVEEEVKECEAKPFIQVRMSRK